MGAGRPTTYDSAYGERVIELGKKGFSRAMMASDIGVCKQTLINWGKANPEFLDALTRADSEAQAFLELQGLKGLTLPTAAFNHNLWRATMQARFREDYTERKELSGPGGGAIKVSTIELVAPDFADDGEDETQD